MKTFEAKTTISASAQTVFDYVSDFTKHGEWAGHGLQVTKDSDGPVAIGSTYSTVAKQFGTQREHSTVTELEPGRSSAGTRRARSAPCIIGSRWLLPMAGRPSRRARSSWTARSWPR
jgi:Polyketide cyclase / dehydrase and lipid transport